MPKFVLIDHSITEIGGHHYEYAMRVLPAAAQAGYEPVLATNRRLHGIGPCPWRIVRAYRYDFFQPGPPRRLRRLCGWLDTFRHGVARTKCRGMLRPGAAAWQRAHRWRKRTAFGADSVRLFREVRLDEGDVVFLPTLLDADMLGLLRLFHANPDTAKATWHLLFRRNVYQGREPDYAAQDESLQPLRSAFREFEAQLRGQRVYFYTDTESLTIQYNRLGVASFRTAPIPVGEGFRVQSSGFREESEVRGQTVPLSPAPPLPCFHAPLVPLSHTASDGPATRAEASALRHVVYLGDARTEKGYHWLPRLVEDAFAAKLPARFTLQSNYNVPGGEPAAVVARARLEAAAADRRVRLIPHALGSEEYRRLLFAADVVVIPYDRDHYYARSSGVFAEALAAGKPVVVPAGTWMAAELSSAIYDYHDVLGQRHRTLAGIDRPLQIHGKTPTTCRLDVPPEATHLLVKFRLADHQPGLFAGVTAEQFAADNYGASRGTGSPGPCGRLVGRSGRCGRLGRSGALVSGRDDPRGSLLAPLAEGVAQIELSVYNALSALPLSLNEIRIDFLAAPEGLPASAVGAVYAEPGELADCVREVLAHYDHYLASAIGFSHRWAEHHSPETLIEQLVARSRMHRPAAAVDASSVRRRTGAPRTASRRLLRRDRFKAVHG